MITLISADLMRLRTLRSTAYGTLGGLALIAVLASLPLFAAGSRPSSADGVHSDVEGLIAPIVFTIAIISANAVGGQFKRGTVAMTYLAHPLRDRVTAAQMVIWGGLCGLFAAVASLLVVSLELAAARAADIDPGLSAGALAQLIAGAGFAGAVLGGAGVLAATVTRDAMMAAGAVVGLNVVEGLLSAGVEGSGRYLPLSLTSSVMGLDHAMPPLAAMALLVAYLAAFALAVRMWALPRDLT